jgi:NAD(P)-dependent dehydrogenase (short-subunit alcohol dehydrogenase family)
MKMSLDLIDKKILVTGASSGIGRAVAILCSSLGANVIITARNEGRLKESFSSLKGEGHRMILADLTCSEDRENLVRELPSLDGVVQNAGVGSRVLCKNITEDDINFIFNPNLKAPVLLQSLLLANKKINKGASVVFIASRAAQYPSVGNAVYSASKGAILAYSKCLGLELASKQIRVNCVSPGMVMTDFVAKSGLEEDVMEGIGNKYPLKRYGKPEDVANLVVYLLSDASQWMTGSCIDIDGGGEGTLV